MPRVSVDHLQARRRQILDGARAAFARHGYEGATVRILEQEIGLSRGAIFHHYADKDALFLALAAQDANVIVHTVAEHRPGPGDAGDGRCPDAGRLGVQLEVARRVRTDADFRAAWAPYSARIHQATLDRLDRQRASGSLRADVDKLPAARHHSGNGVNLARHRRLLADDFWIAGKVTLPERMADHDHARRVRLVILRPKTAAQQWADAKDVKNIGRRSETGNILRVLARAPDGRGPGVGGHRGKGVILRPQIAKIRKGMDRFVLARMLRRGRPDHREAIRVWKRKRAQQDSVDDTEDRAVRADPEGESEHGNESEAGRLNELAKSVAEIV